MVKRILNYFNYNRELYGYLPIGILLTIGAIHWVVSLTGRPVLDDPTTVVSFLFVLLKLQLLLIPASHIATHLFDDASHQEFKKLSLGEKILDSCKTAFALLFCLFAVWLLR